MESLIVINNANSMSYGACVSDLKPGRYRHFKGNDYELVALATHSESLQPMVVYRALYGEGGLWVRPLAMFTEQVTRDGISQPRFQRLSDE